MEAAPKSSQHAEEAAMVSLHAYGGSQEPAFKWKFGPHNVAVVQTFLFARGGGWTVYECRSLIWDAWRMMACAVCPEMLKRHRSVLDVLEHGRYTLLE